MKLKPFKGINTNWIYVYFRNPHHLAPFKNTSIFIHHFLPGIIFSFVLLMLCIFVFSKHKNKFFSHLNNLNIAIFSFQLLFILVGYFDKTGAILKYYPFRSNALSLLLILVEITHFIKFYPNLKVKLSRQTANALKPIFIFTSILFIAYYGVIAILNHHENNKRKDVNIIATYLEANTNKNSIVLNLINNNEFLPLMRKSERKIFVINKFVPTTSDLLYEWYKRNKILEEVRKNPAYIEEVCMQYQIDFVVSMQEIKSSHYQEVFSHNHYFIYQVNCQHAMGELIFRNRNLKNTVHQTAY